MSSRLDGAIAVVTGAARGLGREIALRLAGDGATVAGLDTAEDAGPPLEEDGPGSITNWTCDVSDRNEVQRTIGEVADRFGGVDVLVNNAGLLSGRASLLEASPADMHRFYEVNAVGPLLMVQACFPFLRDSVRRGRIVNVASRTFFTGAPGQIAYIASKGALLGMTRVMARELGEYGICVNAAMPAQVATPGTREHSDDEAFARTMSHQSIREFVTPQDFAGLVAFLASADAARITGQSIVCDGGGFLH